MDDFYDDIDEHNANINRKILIVFDDMIAEMLSTKILNPEVTELFIRVRKLNISPAFTIFSCSTEKYQTKFYTLLYHKNCKQTRASTKSN